MWIHVEKTNEAFNTDHISRLYVEITPSGAALKAEVSGKTCMIGYYQDKMVAARMLKEIMDKRSAGVAVVHV